MVSNELATKLTNIAGQQLEAGTKMKQQRMQTVTEIEDLYNNKILIVDDGRINIPFPIMSGQIDTLYSKIDNPPSVSYRIPNKQNLADRVAAAWKIDSSSSRSGWSRKDRAEKKLALFSGRGIAKIFSSNVEKKYETHYEVVDHRSFICEGTRGFLEDNLYCGEVDIYKTEAELKQMASLGIYNKDNVQSLLSGSGDDKTTYQAYANQYDRMRMLGLNPEQNAYVGQKIANLAEWYLEYEGSRYYLLFDPKSSIWLRCEKMIDIFGHEKYPYVSWAVNYDEYNFWSKGAGDDIMPMAEAMRITLNEALENNRRRNRPMRIVESGQIQDVNELLEYIPDNIIVSNPGRNSAIVTLETPEVTTSINMVEFLNRFMGEKSGISGALQGTPEQDAKVGIYYGTLQQAADRIGTINKEYSESYAQKGYRYFWGLKMNLTGSKAIEMLGKFGYAWEELDGKDLKDVDDVDDVVVSGGSSEEALDEVKKRRRSETLASLTANQMLAQKLNPTWVIRTSLQEGEFTDDEIQEALDSQSDQNRELMLEADQAIQEILEGKTPKLNRGANVAFVQRIIDWEKDNINYIKEDGSLIKKQYELSQKILGYAEMHMQPPFLIVQNNMVRDVRQVYQEQLRQGVQPDSSAVNIPQPTTEETRQSITQPFEAGMSPEGTASASQQISDTLNPVT